VASSSSPFLANERPASAAIAAIRAGDLGALAQVLAANPALAGASIARRNGSTLTLLHVVADWPGHFPNGPAVVARVVAAGGKVAARSTGRSSQTPLHWAASCGDVGVLDALLDAGADIEAAGAFGDLGGPLDNAVAFGQWVAARRLVERGASTGLWQAAALGLTARIEERFAARVRPTPGEVTEAFWQACHGGQRAAAESLLERGADLNWVGYDESTPLDVARRSNENAGSPTCSEERLSELVSWLLARGARSAHAAG
jgi:uncharacterized protein